MISAFSAFSKPSVLFTPKTLGALREISAFSKTPAHFTIKTSAHSAWIPCFLCSSLCLALKSVDSCAAWQRGDFLTREAAAAGVGVVAFGDVVRHGERSRIADLRRGRFRMKAVASFAERVADAARGAMELEEEAAQAVGAPESGRDFSAPVKAEEVVVKPVGEVYAGQVVGAFTYGEPPAEARAVEVEKGNAREASFGFDQLDVLVAKVAVCAA